MAYVRTHPVYSQYRMKIGVMPDFSGANQVFQEEPIGAKNNENKVFRLRHEPIRDSEMVFKDGMFMRKGADKDYLLNGKEIIFKEAPPPNAVIAVNYRYMGEG